MCLTVPGFLNIFNAENNKGKRDGDIPIHIVLINLTLAQRKIWSFPLALVISDIPLTVEALSLWASA